jgi:uncharacterized protein YjiS (DUF1127 family)
MDATTSLPARRDHRPVARRIERSFAALAWFLHVVADIWREWHGNERCVRALAALDDDDLPNLSEAGQTLRREARRNMRVN